MGSSIERFVKQLPSFTHARPSWGSCGAVDPRLLMGGGVLLLVALALVLFSGPPEHVDGPGGEPVPIQNLTGEKPTAAELEIADGLPLPGVGPLQVTLSYLGSRDDSLVTVHRPGVLMGKVYGFEGQGAEASLTVVGGPQDGLQAFTKEDGTYRMDGLIPGLHFFRIEGRSILPAVRMQRVTGRNQTRRDFFFGESVTAQLALRDHKNKPLEGAVVSTDLGMHRGVSGEDGLVTLDGVAGGRRVVVDIRAEGHVPVRYELNLFGGLLTGAPIELPPLPVGGRVRGQVRSWPGGPLPTVTMVPRASSIGAFQVAWENWQEVSVDREGRFVLEDVPITHLLDVRAFHPSGVSDPRVRAVQPSISAAATADFVIRQAKAVVTAEIVDEAGQPIAGAPLRLEAVNPDRVLAALYPGLGESQVGVRLPVPAQLLREGKTDADGRFEFALGDHPQGTGHLLLTAEAKGKRSARREVKTVGKHFRIELQDVRPTGSVMLERRDGGPIPTAEYWLDGEPVSGASGLEQGFYRVSVRRGEVPIKTVEQLWVEGETGLDLGR